MVIGRVVRVFRSGLAMMQLDDGDVRVVTFPRERRPAPGVRGALHIQQRRVVDWRPVGR
jgi:hypothetical protein